MQYIILDMEWNQAWPGSSAARQGIAPHGEIIQIGAVRLLADRTVADEFQILIRPKFIRKLNKRVSKLTGIQEARLKAEGVPFPEAVERFRSWCGEDCTFLTWGFDDVTVLRENLALHDLPADWVLPWYNAQMIFNAQTDGSTNQRALKTALELLRIVPTRPAHDALGDAYHTALICARLDLERGVAEYRWAMEAHENGFHGAELPGCIARRVYRGYADKRAAMGAMAGAENLCPHCEKPMKAGEWISQPGRRYMNLSTCDDHGNFLVRIRLQQDGDGIRVSKLLYERTSEAAKAYEKAAASARPRRRHRRRKKTAAPVKPES